MKTCFLIAECEVFMEKITNFVELIYQTYSNMVLSTLQNSDRVEPLHPLFKKAFDYVKSHDMLHMPCGKIEIDGDNLFINNSNPDCVDKEQQALEIHRKYIDIHVLLEGEETVGWKSLENCSAESKAYDEINDCAIYSEPASTYFTLHPGQFLIAWPEDAHAPVIGTGKIRKLIVKVKI